MDNDYPINSTARTYKDQDGNDITLRQLIKLEPEWAHSRIKIAEALEQEVERLKITSMNLVDAVENNDDLPPIKYALKCGRLVNEVRSLCGKTLTPALHKEGES